MNSKKKKSYFRSKAGPKLIYTRITLRVFILALGVTVIYDSFMHDTPFYYILFYIIGRITGYMYGQIFSIEKTEDEKYELRSNGWGIAVTLILFALRHFFGKLILESMHVIWITDALYLYFIGIYYTKWKVIINQIHDLLYISLFKNKM